MNSITLIGCGKMGSALLRIWQSRAVAAHFNVIEPHDIDLVPSPTLTHFRSVAEAAEALETTDVIVLAVKPQSLETLCADLAPHIAHGPLILSIAAGFSLPKFTGLLGETAPVIRAMPNTPAAIGKGMSVAVASAPVTPAQKSYAQSLLESAGTLEWLDNEALLDAVTALSGSGPAYVFHLIETLARAGQNIGLPEDLAMTLARQTVIGAAALAESQPQTPASILRENVTSPKGTTEAALNILMNGRLQDIYDKALKAAEARGRELGR